LKVSQENFATGLSVGVNFDIYLLLVRSGPALDKLVDLAPCCFVSATSVIRHDIAKDSLAVVNFGAKFFIEVIFVLSFLRGPEVDRTIRDD